MAKIETGRQLPSDDDLATWVEHAESQVSLVDLRGMLDEALAEYQAVRRLYEQGGVEGAQQAVAVREAASKTLVLFQPVMFPALVQTPEYARQVIQVPDGFPGRVAEDDLARGVAARIRRQAIMHEPGRAISVLVGEAALWTQATTTDVHEQQLGHVAHLAESLTEATVGVVPFRRMPFVATSGFVLYDDTVQVEALSGDNEIADPVGVQEYRVYARLLQEAALTGADAARLIRDVRASFS